MSSRDGLLIKVCNFYLQNFSLQWTLNKVQGNYFMHLLTVISLSLIVFVNNVIYDSAVWSLHQ